MNSRDKELILRMADLYCEMAHGKDGAPTSFTNMIKAASEFDALMDALSLTGGGLELKGIPSEKLVEIKKHVDEAQVAIREGNGKSAKDHMQQMNGYVMNEVMPDQISMEFAAFLGIVMREDDKGLEGIAQTGREMWNAGPDDIEALERGINLVQELFEKGKVSGSAEGGIFGELQSEMV